MDTHDNINPATIADEKPQSHLRTEDGQPQKSDVIPHDEGGASSTTLHSHMEGVELHGAFKDAVKTQDAVVLRAIDPVRDQEIGKNISKYNLNYFFEPKDDRDMPLKSFYGENIDINNLPTRASVRGEWGEIMDQGELGSCVANSVCGCIRFVRRKEGLSVYDPSRLYNYYYGRKVEGFPLNEDTGLYIRSGYKSVAHYSVCSEKTWPYAVRRFTQEPTMYARNAAANHKTFSYFSIPHDLKMLKKCIADGYPISFGFTVFSSFMTTATARTGYVPVPNQYREEILGGHCMTIVGYDDTQQHFIVANSWGKDWGENGYCYFPYEFMMDFENVSDFWTARRFV